MIAMLVADGHRAFDAERGSGRLLRALLRYGARHGLPNIAPEDCRRRARHPQSAEASKRFLEKRWTAAEDEIALAARSDGMSFGQIALRLPGRTDYAIAARLRVIKPREAGA